MRSSNPNTAGRAGDLLVPNPKLRLREQVREVMRFKHYAVRTEETYWGWIRQFILFHGKRHPREMGLPEVEAFLTHLAAGRDVAVATQNQALNALVFLYGQVTRSQRQAALVAMLFLVSIVVWTASCEARSFADWSVSQLGRALSRVSSSPKGLVGSDLFPPGAP
jgi:hypothetical protein